MNWSAFWGAWLGTWLWVAAGLIAYVVGWQALYWLKYNVFTPWRKVDRMKRGKEFTPEQWDIFINELRKVSDAQQGRTRTHKENEAKIELLTKRMKMAQDRAMEAYIDEPEDTIKRQVLAAIVLLLNPTVGLHEIDLDAHLGLGESDDESDDEG
jgi:hypothetical protein